MREIKFRAWLKRDSRMEWHDELLQSDYDSSCDLWYYISRPDDFWWVIIMQYIWLKDKNWMDIYEWDVLSDWWWVKIEGWCTMLIDIKTWSEFGVWDIDIWNYEVIGNIYSNPELLWN